MMENFVICMLLALSLIPFAVLAVTPAKTFKISDPPKPTLVSFKHDYDTGTDVPTLPPDQEGQG